MADQPWSIIYDGWMRMQEIVDDPKHTSGGIGRVDIDNPNPEAVEEGSHQDDEPAYLRIVDMSWSELKEDQQIGLTAEYGVHLVTENSSLFGIFLSGST